MILPYNRSDWPCAYWCHSLKSAVVSYLLLVLLIFYFLQSLSASPSIDKVIVTNFPNLFTLAIWGKYMLSKLSRMYLSKSQCIQKNYLRCWIHKLLAFQHGIYHQLFSIPKKWLWISCGDSFFFLIFQDIFYFVDDNVFSLITLIASYIILPGHFKKPSIWTEKSFRKAQIIILSSEWKKTTSYRSCNLHLYQCIPCFHPLRNLMDWSSNKP